MIYWNSIEMATGYKHPVKNHVASIGIPPSFLYSEQLNKYKGGTQKNRRNKKKKRKKYKEGKSTAGKNKDKQGIYIVLLLI